jgi:hypothetical protein
MLGMRPMELVFIGIIVLLAFFLYRLTTKGPEE